MWAFISCSVETTKSDCECSWTSLFMLRALISFSTAFPLAMQRLLFAVSAMVLVYTVSQNLWFQAPVNIATIKPKFPLRHCWVLTLNKSLQPHTIAPDLTCQPFLAQQFNAEQFAMLSPLARDKLIHPEKQTMASDLTNNNSVSIFANHVRMWKAAAALPEPILILEDDAVLHTNAGHTLQIIMHELINVRLMRNLVLKLSSTTPSFLGIHNPIPKIDR